jgi:hypothetical protein
LHATNKSPPCGGSFSFQVLRKLAVAVRGSGSPATHVAQRIDVTRGTAFFRVNRSQFSEFRRGLFGFRRIFCLYAFLYSLFFQLFLGPANSGYFSKSRFFSQHSAANRLKIAGR